MNSLKHPPMLSKALHDPTFSLQLQHLHFLHEPSALAVEPAIVPAKHDVTTHVSAVSYQSSLPSNSSTFLRFNQYDHFYKVIPHSHCLL